MRRWIGLATTAAWGWCLGACIGPEPFACENDDQCQLSGDQGTCEPEKYCSYPDEACASKARFESHAPGDLAGRCVEPPPGDEGSSSEDDGSGSDTVADGCRRFDMLRAGNEHTCARDLDGGLWCWGRNILSQLGQGSPVVDFIVEPVRVEGPSAVVAFDAKNHTCAVDDTNTLWCWGSNEDQQIELGNQVPRIDAPVAIETPAGTLHAVATGRSTICASFDDELICWGLLLGETPVGPTKIAGVEEPLVFMDGGSTHGCGLTAAGTVLCWGEDGLGQLGDGGGVGSGEAVPVEFIDPGVVRSLAVGADHACAVFEADDVQSVRCWGSNSLGQTGLLLDSQVPFPHTAAGGLAGGQYVGVAAGAAHGCVIAADGSLSCWGDNTYGQSDWQLPSWPEGPNGVAPPFGAAPAIVDLTAGDKHTCALRADGTVDCWGCNEFGQLGGGSRECETGVVTTRVCAPP
ncbi:MAG: hypothetical protein AAF721_41570 [Myxococcota bacterium]